MFKTGDRVKLNYKFPNHIFVGKCGVVSDSSRPEYEIYYVILDESEHEIKCYLDEIDLEG